MKEKLYIFIFLILTPFLVYSQTEEQTIFDEATIVYKNSIYGGAILHTNGWGAHITFGNSKTVFKSRIFQFEMVGMKHAKEIRSFNPYSEHTRSYVFGKLNYFFIFRPSIGNRVVSFDKIRKSGVSVGYNWRVGPSLGFTRPVYLEIGVPGTFAYQDVIVEKYDPSIHKYDDIKGRAGGLRGFNELKLKPGIYGAFAFNFEYDANREGLKGIEVGATVDYYPISEVEIMAFAENRQLFVNFYVCLQFGKKFNK
ncbi:hypothetical protein G3O08_08245 [Cryomorpha ignava]|uniref:PorT family protein n=1 Tax=Cryomorpha ignava TaxID=101383 RepID=A0A7K3WPB2_9FLAO|nr:hypothetical protein [Cryomorpha ignava]NEN23490.1 hypothetical protein [Cryomorpha ignava]